MSTATIETTAQLEMGEPIADEALAARWSPGKLIGFRFLVCALSVHVLERLFRHTLPNKVAALSRYVDLLSSPPKWSFRFLPKECVSEWGHLAWDCWGFKFLWLALCAGIATIAWSLLDRRRANYARLALWFRTVLRYTVATTMLYYAWFKLVGAQFWGYAPAENLPLGMVRRSTFMFTTMGLSYVYGTFTAFGEVLASGLLFFRRTATLGALVTISVMTTVLVMDIYSHVINIADTVILHIIMAVVILAPDLRRMVNVYVLNRQASAPETQPELVHSQWWRWAKWAFLLYTVGDVVHGEKINWHFFRPNNPLSGVYEVESFRQNGVEKPRVYDDSLRWGYVRLTTYWGTWKGTSTYPTLVELYRMDGTQVETFEAATDSSNARIMLTARAAKPDTVGVLHYARTAPDAIELRGTIRKDSVVVRLSRYRAPIVTMLWPLIRNPSDSIYFKRHQRGS